MHTARPIALWLLLANCKARSDTAAPEPAGPEKVIDGVGDIELLVTGDIALGDLLQKRAAQAEKSWAARFPYRDVADRIRRASVAMANLDTVLSARGQRMPHRDGPRADPMWAEGLMRAGFDIVSLANDRVLDWSEEGARDTEQNLRAWQIAAVGLRSRATRNQEPRIVRVHGMPIAFLAYTAIFPQAYRNRFPGPFPADAGHIAEDVRRARSHADAVVVSLHDGRLFDLLPSPRQRKLADAARQAGATVVFGHHARVIQPLEKTPVSVVAFSLGGLLTDGWPPPFAARARVGALLSVKFVKRKLAGATLEPLVQGRDERPQLDATALDVASLETPYQPAGEIREDMLKRLPAYVVARGDRRCLKFKQRPPADAPFQEHFDCGNPQSAVGHTALLSAGVWREVVGASLAANESVTIGIAEALQSDEIVGFVGLEDGTPGPVEIDLRVDEPGLEPLHLRIEAPGWQPLRIATPGLGGQRRLTELRAHAQGAARIGFRLWSVKRPLRQPAGQP